MSDNEEIEAIQAKAAVLVEALPYVRHFRGSTFVVKYGGSFMDAPDPETRSRVARDIVFLNSVGISRDRCTRRRQGNNANYE